MPKTNELDDLHQYIKENLYELKRKAIRQEKNTDLLTLIVRLFNEYDPDQELNDVQLELVVSHQLEQMYNQETAGTDVAVDI